jgi:hypothetical protein
MNTAKEFEFMYSQKRNCAASIPSSLSHIHVSVSDLYIPTFGPPIFLQQNRQTDQRYIFIAFRNMNVGIGTVAAQFLSWEYLFLVFGIVVLQ